MIEEVVPFFKAFVTARMSAQQLLYNSL